MCWRPCRERSSAPTATILETSSSSDRDRRRISGATPPGAGTWHPEPDALAAIRTRIAEQPKAWVKARDEAGFAKIWKLGGESLSRPPRGFAKDHPHIEDLKRKDHIAVCNLAHRDLFGPKVVERVAERFAASKPYLKFLCAALDVPF